MKSTLCRDLGVAQLLNLRFITHFVSSLLEAPRRASIRQGEKTERHRRGPDAPIQAEHGELRLPVRRQHGAGQVNRVQAPEGLGGERTPRAIDHLS